MCSLGEKGIMQKNIDSFLKPYREKKIGLYGTGLNSERVINSVNGYDFCCVISNDEKLIGSEFQGLKIQTFQDAIAYVDVVVIAAIPTSARAVYERIKNAVPESIPIFDLSGIQMNKPRGYMDMPYWNMRYEDLIKEIDQHDVISFDAFDTLLMRKALDPKTVFELMEAFYYEKYALLKYKISANDRLTSEDELYKEGKHPILADIYDRLRRSKADLSEMQISEMIDYEICLECKMMVQREELHRAFDYAISKRKKVYIVSDMYMTKTMIDLFLSKWGIKGYMDILVSCDYGCNKGSGELFEELKKVTKTGNVLHIGDNYEADAQGAKKAKIDSFHILSSKDLLLASSVPHIYGSAFNKWDKLMLGTVLADLKLFNNPFALGEYKGRVYIDSIETMTKMCFTPITLAYISWLIGQLGGKEDSVVLFCSRDGYFLEKIYREIKKNNKGLNLPESVYFYTSRKAMSAVIPADEDGIRTLCANIDQYRKVEILTHLERIYGMPLHEELGMYEGRYFDEIDHKKLIKDIFKVKDKIVYHAENSRIGYLKYIESLGLEHYKNIYMVDLVAQGSSRYGLSRMCRKEVTMLALGTTPLPNAFTSDERFAYSMYGRMITGIGSAVSTMFNLLELVYASTDGQLTGFVPEGNPIFDDSTKYNGNLLKRVQDEIWRFIHSYVDTRWFTREYSLQFVNDMLGVLHPDYSDISDDLWKYFEFQDPLHETSVRHNALEVARGEVHI